MRFTLPFHKMGSLRPPVPRLPGRALYCWPGAHFLCVLLLFAVDFRRAKTGGHLVGTHYG